MRDNNRATLVGEKTFGKGIVQDVFRFGEGFAQITTAHYYTPNGENIHKIGIEPDVFVESLVMSEEELEPFAELMEEKVVSSFIAAHPEPSDANIAAFVNANRERESVMKSQRFFSATSIRRRFPMTNASWPIPPSILNCRRRLT